MHVQVLTRNAFQEEYRFVCVEQLEKQGRWINTEARAAFLIESRTRAAGTVSKYGKGDLGKLI